MTDEPKLKPCPFCGSGDAVSIGNASFSGVELTDYHGKIYASCGTCGFYLSPSDDVSTAIANWNTRHTPPEVQALVDALREILSADENGSQADLLFSCDKARPALTNWEATNGK